MNGQNVDSVGLAKSMQNQLYGLMAAIPLTVSRRFCKIYYVYFQQRDDNRNSQLGGRSSGNGSQGRNQQ